MPKTALVDSALSQLRRLFEIAQNYTAKLPPADFQVLDDYVAAGSGMSTKLRGGRLAHAWEINDALRRGELPPVVPHIDEILKAAPRTKEPVVLYRGMPVGLKSDKGFQSVSINPDVADAYALGRNEEGPGDVLIGRHRIEVPPNTPLVAPDLNGQWFDEDELLLPRGLKFNQLGKSGVRTRTGNDPWYDIRVKEMPYKRGGLAQMRECRHG